jgi:hypothetical protein
MIKVQVTIETDRNFQWIKKQMEIAVNEINDRSYRGFGFIQPIKSLEVKQIGDEVEQRHLPANRNNPSDVSGLCNCDE